MRTTNGLTRGFLLLLLLVTGGVHCRGAEETDPALAGNQIQGEPSSSDAEEAPQAAPEPEPSSSGEPVGDPVESPTSPGESEPGDTVSEGSDDGTPNAGAETTDHLLDSDGDGIADAVDNCSVPNPAQKDRDADGLGDACDPCPADPTDDADDDGFCADEDNCATIANPDQANSDGLADGGDLCDTCPATPNPPAVGACNPKLTVAKLCGPEGCSLGTRKTVILTIPANALIRPTSISITASPEATTGPGITALHHPFAGVTVAAWLFRPLGLLFAPCDKEKTDLEADQSGCAEGTFYWTDTDKDGCVDEMNGPDLACANNTFGLAERFLAVFKEGDDFMTNGVTCLCQSETDPTDLQDGGCTKFPEPNGNACASNPIDWTDPSPANKFIFRIERF